MTTIQDRLQASGARGRNAAKRKPATVQFASSSTPDKSHRSMCIHVGYDSPKGPRRTTVELTNEDVDRLLEWVDKTRERYLERASE